MKYFKTIIFIAFLILFNSCSSSFISLEDGKKIDTRLVGTWVGSEKDQQIEGIEKEWEMIRNADGTFILHFVMKKNGISYPSIEEGNWWVKNGFFYEFHEDSGKTDYYKYKILNQDQVRFISKSIGVDMNSDEYSFIDTKK